MWRNPETRKLQNDDVTKEKRKFEHEIKTVSLKCQMGKSIKNLYVLKLTDTPIVDKIIAFLYRPTDPASLGIVRALFGLCMVLDVVEERGLADIDIKWGDPMECHFPLIHGMRPPTLPWTIVIYTVMWMGAFGIMLGSHFKFACACFVIPYWYIFLLEKSYWNNHTYLYGIVATLFWGTEANKYFALDAKKARKTGCTVPYWNYFILKFQFFILYFMAGLKKSGKEWLDGYAMTKLSEHWVFSPFKLFLTTEQTDFLIVHWFAFVFDLTVGFWMLYDKTRVPAMIFCTAFHLMNSRLFSIGMFPYVCLATMPLFCNVNWPRKLYYHFNYNNLSIFNVKSDSKKSCEHLVRNEVKKNEEIKSSSIKEVKESSEVSNKVCKCSDNDGNNKSPVMANIENQQSLNQAQHELQDIHATENNEVITTSKNKEIDQPWMKITRKKKFVTMLLLFHIFLQFFLPYSHFITKGYNNWVPGLYGYSWDMMVYAWDTVLVVIKVHDNISNEDHYLDPKAWVQTDRWERHADMARQYAFCLKSNLKKQRDEAKSGRFQYEVKQKWTTLSSNLSIYIDVWCSLNGRFQQRMFNPSVDLLTVDWHPFKPVSFLMPLLTQYNSYRYKLEEIQREVYTWSNYTDVLFVADFPGMHLDNYISTNFTNVSLTVLEGEVTYTDEQQTKGILITKGTWIPIKTGRFHKVKTTSTHPACYMYTYTTPSKEFLEADGTGTTNSKEVLPIRKEIKYKINAWSQALKHITDAFFYLVYDVPMVRRVLVNK